MSIIVTPTDAVQTDFNFEYHVNKPHAIQLLCELNFMRMSEKNAAVGYLWWHFIALFKHTHVHPHASLSYVLAVYYCRYWKFEHETTTNCGINIADVLDKCFSEHNGNPRNSLVRFYLVELHNAYLFNVLLHLLPFGSNLKGEFGDPNFGCVRGELGVGCCANRKPPTTF